MDSVQTRKFQPELTVQRRPVKVALWPMHVVSITIIPMRARAGAGRALLERQREYRHASPTPFGDV
jgi:hypothetical protein